MARYKAIDTSPRFLAVDLRAQLIPGTFEHALDWIVDHELDLSGFDARYRNDARGAAAYPPALLLKLVLFGYSRGIVASRAIERACREQIVFIALSGDQCPHFSTLAGFVSNLGEQIAPLFARILHICEAQGLIGREMFAIDGVKLPGNASKRKSGTRADYARQAAKLEAAARTMIERHRQNDALPLEPDLAAKEQARLEAIQREAAQLRQWLDAHPKDRRGPTGGVRKSNRTDNESAKMATDKGVIQGYCGVAAVDARHQIIVEAQAHGTGSEQELLVPVVEAIGDQLSDDSLITADAGYHSKDNVVALAARNIAALIADPGMRKRDERFKEQARHKTKDPLHDKHGKSKSSARYRPQDFRFDPQSGTCTCPAGKRLYRNGGHCTINGYAVIKFQGAQRDCVPCSERSRCLRHPEKTKTRQVHFFQGKQQPDAADALLERMRQAIDSDRGRQLYGRRFATVEPVFANIRHNKKLNRFTLRGRAKVDTQWKLYCLVHNIEKLAHHGYAQ